MILRPFDPWKSQLCTCPAKLSLNPYTGCPHGCLYCYASSYIPRFARVPPQGRSLEKTGQRVIQDQAWHSGGIVQQLRSLSTPGRRASAQPGMFADLERAESLCPGGDQVASGGKRCRASFRDEGLRGHNHHIAKRIDLPQAGAGSAITGKTP